MSSQELDTARLETKDDLVAYLAQGVKPAQDWRIGTEHEKFGFHLNDLTPLSYDGSNGIRALLENLQKRYGWDPILENGQIIGLRQPGRKLGGSITLEPGGQIELSGAPLKTIHETCQEVHEHLSQVRSVGKDHGIGMLGLGFSPQWTYAQTPHMPKDRYDIMKNYMPQKGNLGLDMMFRSCTVQVNLDFSDEADMIKKYRVALALQPIVTALFANSPFKEGKPSGFLSYRSAIWLDTDPDRTGMLDFVFEDGMSFERYVDYALDVPMYFVVRNGQYLDMSGKSFRNFLDGKLEVLEGQKPALDDWEGHLTTLFPEVRLKRFLEMRGADGGPWSRLCALPAFWVGLLYDQSALDAAWDLVKDWSVEERNLLRQEVPRTALHTQFRNTNVQKIALEALAISKQGLKSRNLSDAVGNDETMFLSELDLMTQTGKTSADILLEKYHSEWNESVASVFQEYAY
ncbi:MAG: glutamate--cysteine ligase [Pseudomonadota bacterium]